LYDDNDNYGVSGRYNYTGVYVVDIIILGLYSYIDHLFMSI